MTTSDTIRVFESAIQTFHYLLYPAKFGRYSVIICKSNDLCYIKVPAFFRFTLLTGKWIRAVTICNKF